MNWAISQIGRNIYTINFMLTPEFMCLSVDWNKKTHTNYVLDRVYLVRVDNPICN